MMWRRFRDVRIVSQSEDPWFVQDRSSQISALRTTQLLGWAYMYTSPTHTVSAAGETKVQFIMVTCFNTWTILAICDDFWEGNEDWLFCLPWYSELRRQKRKQELMVRKDEQEKAKRIASYINEHRSKDSLLHRRTKVSIGHHTAPGPYTPKHYIIHMELEWNMQE